MNLEAAGQVRTVVLGAKELVVGLAPTAMATNAMGQGGETLPREGSLTGQPKRPSPSEKNADNLRAIERENESARVLARNGYDVEQSPRPKSNGKEPDYKLNGEYADCYAPSTDNPRSILNNVAEKVNKDQANRIVLNLEDSRMDLSSLKRQLLEDPIANLKEIIVIRNGRPIPFYP